MRKIRIKLRKVMELMELMEHLKLYAQICEGGRSLEMYHKAKWG